MGIVKPDFFRRPTLEVAPDLLGLHLVRRDARGKILAAQITEVEAYLGPEDLASHSRFASKQRNGVMFGPGGAWYVYLIYGIHYMLNIVTCGKGEGGAILFRGLAGWPGPGRLAKGIEINKKLNGLACSRASGLWIERRNAPPPKGEIATSPRIGVDYAGPHWSTVHHRFYWKRFVKK